MSNRRRPRSIEAPAVLVDVVVIDPRGMTDAELDEVVDRLVAVDHSVDHSWPRSA